MAGIYLHIPFCRKACNYCNFHFSTSLKLKNDLINALLKEIELTATGNRNQPGFTDEVIETIYFGGGTPSLLTGNEINQILEKIRSYYSITGTAELTFEANPDDIDIQSLKTWKAAGINRLS